jgi:hypothetical protein
MGEFAGESRLSFLGVALKKQACILPVISIFAALLLPLPTAFADDLSAESLLNISGQTQTQLHLIVTGDVTTNIDGSVNPFGTNGTIFSSYNALSNTTLVTFSGPGITNGGSAMVGLSTTVSDQLQYKYWGISSTPPGSASLRLPAPSLFVTTPLGSSNRFAILFATVQANGQTAGEWEELRVPVNQSFKFSIGNFDNLDGSLTLSNVGFQLSNTQIPLEDLNTTDYPTNSFTPVPGIPDGTSIDPGSSLQSPDVPEPSSLLLTVSALIAVALVIRRREGISP